MLKFRLHLEHAVLPLGDTTTWIPVVLLALSPSVCDCCNLHVNYSCCLCSVAPGFAIRLFYSPGNAVGLLPAGTPQHH